MTYKMRYQINRWVIKMDRYCAHCGAKLEDDVEFCAECGSMIGKKKDTAKKTINVEENNETEDEVKNEPNNTNIRNDKSDMIFCIVGIVIVVIVLFGIISLFTGFGHTNIDGVNFNIPSGFEAGETQKYVKQGHDVTEVVYKEKEGTRLIKIEIVDDYQIETKNRKTETIHGHTGIKYERVGSGGTYVQQFGYNVGNKYVIVSTGNMEVDDVIC